MKNAKISRRSFLLGLAACSAAGVLTACKGTDAPSGSTRLPLPQSARVLCSVLFVQQLGAVPDRGGVSRWTAALPASR
ncbi:MAG: twin-arginine translocation signal domain-containing protein [Faecalibacterium prausnitzii]